MLHAFDLYYWLDYVKRVLIPRTLAHDLFFGDRGSQRWSSTDEFDRVGPTPTGLGLYKNGTFQYVVLS